MAKSYPFTLINHTMIKKKAICGILVTTNEKGESVNLGEYSISYADDYKFGEDFLIGLKEFILQLM